MRSPNLRVDQVTYVSDTRRCFPSSPQASTVFVQGLFSALSIPQYIAADSRSFRLICNAKCSYVAAERIVDVVLLPHEQKCARVAGRKQNDAPGKRSGKRKVVQQGLGNEAMVSFRGFRLRKFPFSAPKMERKSLWRGITILVAQYVKCKCKVVPVLNLAWRHMGE